jgi:hypothetical protein
MKRLCLALFLIVGVGAPAQAWWSKGYLPACISGPVVATIKQNFAYADRRTFHWGVGIKSFTGIHETPQQIRSASLIARRYCRGTALLSDGRRSEVVYLIESKQGFASIGWRVQSCLPAYDPWHVYDGWCRSAEP